MYRPTRYSCLSAFLQQGQRLVLRVHALASVLGLMLTASLALAQQGPKAESTDTAWVYVGADAPSKLQQGLFESAALAVDGQTGRLSLAAIEVYEGQAGQKRKQAVDEAREKLMAGQKALDDLDNQKSSDLFEEAIDALWRSDLRQHFALYVKTLTLQAASRAMGGDTAGTKRDIARLVGLVPKVDLPPQYFSPDIIKFAEAQRKLQGSEGKGDLTVRSEPPGANVWVDGVYRGVSPVTVPQLSATKHVVSAALGGRALTQVEAAPGTVLVTLKPGEFATALMSAQAEVAAHQNDARRDQVLRKLGKALGVSQVLLMLVKKANAGEQRDVTALRLSVADGHNFAYEKKMLTPNAAGQLTSLVRDVLAQSTPRKGGPVTHFEGASAGLSTRKVAGLSLMGVGVALVATGVVTGLQARAAQQEFEVTPQTNTTISQNIQSRGRTFSIVADISYLLGAAGLVSGGVLAFTGGGTPAAASSQGENDDTAARPAPSKAGKADAPPVEREVKPEPKPEPKPKPLTAEEKKKQQEEEKMRRLQAEQEVFDREEAEAKALEEAAKKKTAVPKKTDPPMEGKASESKKADAGKSTSSPTVEPKETPAVDKKADSIEKKRREEEEKKRKAEEERKKNAQEDDLKNF
jgi:PEGA domain